MRTIQRGGEEKTVLRPLFAEYRFYFLNQCWVLRQNRTSMSITGTSIRTPTTVARAAPEDRPKSIVAVAIATSKWLEAPIIAAGAASL